MSYSSNGILVVGTVFLRIKSTFETCWVFFPLTVKQQASFPVKVPVASSRLALGLHMVECGAKISRKFPHIRCRVIEICCLIRAFFRTIIDCPKIFQLTFAGRSTESSFFFLPVQQRFTSEKLRSCVLSAVTQRSFPQRSVA